MPAKSKAQYKLMAGICNRTYPSGYRGISKKVACEFVKRTKSLKGLPTKVKKRKTKKKRKKTRKKK